MVLEKTLGYKKPMKHFIPSPRLAAVMIALSYSGLSTAEDSKSITPDHVVELFTSQGCSSCPPANRFINALSEDTDKLVLTYGVTYWDYLGWKDTFAKPEFTARQRDYNKRLELGSVYTPQIVLNGSAHSPRYSSKDVETMALPNNNNASVSINEGADGLQITTRGLPEDAGVILLTYTPGKQEVPVKAGENRGRKLTVSNVVSKIHPIRMPANNNVTDYAAGLKTEPGQAYALLVHDPDTVKIVTAAKYIP